MINGKFEFGDARIEDTRPLPAYDLPGADVPEVLPARGDLDFWAQAVMLNLTLGRLGTSRRVSSEVVNDDTQADKSWLRVTKSILECAEYDLICKHDAAIRQYVSSISSPSMFKGGVYLVGVKAIERVHLRLRELQIMRRSYVDAFLSVYSQAQDTARMRLGNLFSEKDYPPVDRVAAAFVFSWQWFEFRAASALQSVSSLIYEAERDKARATIQSAVDESVALLRGEFADLVSHMVDRLTPGEDGKPRTFRDSMLQNFSEFLEMFSAKNIAGDVDLAAVVSRARELLGGRSAQGLRDDGVARARVRQGFTEIKIRLDNMVSDKPQRRIIIADDESKDGGLEEI